MSYDSVLANAEREFTNLKDKRRVGRSLAVVSLDSVEGQELRWLWPGRFPAGKLSIVGGDPGLGKSLFSIDMASRVSVGFSWPDGEQCPQGSTLLISAEDDAADTIKPRAEASGGDAKKIHIVQAVTEHNAKGETIHSSVSVKDTDVIEKAIIKLGDCRLVVLDPISAYLAGTDSHKSADVRQLLTPLAKVASKTGTAIVMISHFNKSQSSSIQYRFNGSLDFSAVCRASWAIGKDPEDDERRLLVPIKMNLAKDTEGLAYRVIAHNGGQPTLDWESAPVNQSASDIFSNVSNGEQTQLEEASVFLEDVLSQGPVNQKDVMKDARVNGFSEATIRRAKAKLKVSASKSGFSGGWRWALPEEE